LIEAILSQLAQLPTGDTAVWSWNGSLIMNICMIIGIVIARVGIRQKGRGPALPLLQPILGKNFGVPELLAGLSIGHLLGVITVITLATNGTI
jgi:photosystem I subunit 10